MSLNPGTRAQKFLRPPAPVRRDRLDGPALPDAPPTPAAAGRRLRGRDPPRRPQRPRPGHHAGRKRPAPDHEIASDVIEACLPHAGRARRVGITGVPGVGKSTFVEALRPPSHARTRQAVAVLAVDPSSAVSGGSILGDKTRMERLAPTPAGLHPAFPVARLAGRRGAAHARGDAALRSGRLSTSSSRPLASGSPRPPSDRWSTSSCC